MGIGALWFSKVLFGVPWAKVGKNVSDLKISNNRKGLIFPAIGSISGAYFLAVLLKSTDIESIGMSILLGLVVGVVFIGTALMSNYYFMGRTRRRLIFGNIKYILHEQYCIMVTLCKYVQEVWTSCYPYTKSKLKTPHFTEVISVWTNVAGVGGRIPNLGRPIIC